MNPFSPLLVATDFSDAARRAVDRAAILATETGVRGCSLMHAFSEPTLARLRGLLRGSEQIDRTLLADTRVRLDELAAEVERTTGVRFDTEVRAGSVVDVLLEASRSAALTVVGARGAHAPYELALGSTAERLVRRGALPLLLVKRAPSRAYRRVMVPVDFSGPSLQALACVPRIARDPEVILLHAYEIPFEDKLRHAGISGEEIEYARQQAERAAEQDMDRLVADSAVPGASHRIVEHGYPPHLIRQTEEGLEPDLIVMGKHGRGKVADYLLGSVTRYVLARTGCDILIVPD